MVDEDDIPTGEVDVEPEDEGKRLFGFADQLEFFALIEELLANEHTRILDYETHKPAPDIVVTTIEAGIGLTVPEAILTFYQRVSDGFDLSWSYEEDGVEVPGGQIALLNFARVFGTWLDELWGVFDEPAREDFSWEIRGLERPHPSIPEFQTVLHFPPNEHSFSLHYYAPHGPSIPLNVDFMDYIDLLRLSRGFHGWQFLVSDVDFEAVPLAAEIAERFHRVMPRIFPDDDFSAFRKP